MENTPTKSNGVATVSSDLITNLVLQGDISKMDDTMKVKYYNQLCQSLNLNPVTRPFQIISFQGKSVLYATKDCTEQLRKINGVSVIDIQQEIKEGLIITKCKVQDKTGRYDMASGIVVMPVSPLDKANALMKSETKAKRRATLSVCGLGILDESELDTMPKYETSDISETKSDTKNPFKELENSKTLDELKLIWSVNKDLQKDETFKKIKEKRKNELTGEVEQAIKEELKGEKVEV